MTSAALRVHVFTPAGTVLEVHARGLRARDASGAFGVRPGHQPLVTALVPSVLEVDLAEGGATERIAVDGGLFTCEGDRVQVATRDAVWPLRLEDARGALEERFRERRGAEAGTRRALERLERNVLAALAREGIAAPGRGP